MFFIFNTFQGDGVANPHEICLALACEAMDMGVKVMEQCSVRGVKTENGKVKSVECKMGNGEVKSVECEYFVNSAGSMKKENMGLN